MKIINDNNQHKSNDSSGADHFMNVIGTNDTSKSRGSKKVALLLISLSLVFISAVIAVLAWYVSTSNKENTQNGDVVVKQAFYQDTVSAARGSVDGKYIFTDSISSLGGHADASIVFDFAPYKVKNADFKSLPVTGDGFALSVPSVEADNKYALLVKFFSDHKDVFQPQDVDVADAGGLVIQPQGISITDYRMYISKEAVCSLSKLASADSDEQIVGVGCADMQSYKESAKAAKQFYEAAKNETTVSPAMQIFASPNEVSGKDDTRHAFVYQLDSQSKSHGLYAYYLTAGGSWKLFNVLPESGTFLCEQFNSREQKNAFNGLGCMDATNQLQNVNKL